MRILPLLLALTFICLPAYASEEALIEPESALDQPVKTDHVELKPSNDFPIDAENPPSHGDVACHYYPHVMVKQIDTGEKGAAQLSWILVDKEKPACKQENAKDEYVLPPDAWSGYFESAQWPYLYFGADDGSNGGMGFVVFEATSHKQVLEDIAVGNVESVKHDASGATLKYKRAWRAPCSIVSQGDACWNNIVHNLGIPVSPVPNCTEEYQKQKLDMAQMQCQSAGTGDDACIATRAKALDAQKWNNAPSVISYSVEATIKGTDSTIKPAGGEISCYPGE